MYRIFLAAVRNLGRTVGPAYRMRICRQHILAVHINIRLAELHAAGILGDYQQIRALNLYDKRFLSRFPRGGPVVREHRRTEVIQIHLYIMQILVGLRKAAAGNLRSVKTVHAVQQAYIHKFRLKYGLK